MLRANQHENVYIVNQITDDLNEFALIFIMQKKKIFSDVDDIHDAINEISTHTNDKKTSTMNSFFNINVNVETYKLWHRRFAYLDAAKLWELHRVITLKRSILIVENKEKSCQICAVIKLCNKRNHHVSERKSTILILVSINICDSLLLLRQEYQYFMKLIDNHSRRIWIILLKDRSKAIQLLHKWRFKIELQSDVKILTVWSDNASELKLILNEWSSTSEVAAQYIISYNSYQNESAERDIRSSEESTHVIIKNVDLLIEFWSEIVETNVYLRN